MQYKYVLNVKTPHGAVLTFLLNDFFIESGVVSFIDKFGRRCWFSMVNCAIEENKNDMQ